MAWWKRTIIYTGVIVLLIIIASILLPLIFNVQDQSQSQKMAEYAGGVGANLIILLWAISYIKSSKLRIFTKLLLIILLPILMLTLCIPKYITKISENSKKRQVTEPTIEEMVNQSVDKAFKQMEKIKDIYVLDDTPTPNKDTVISFIRNVLKEQKDKQGDICIMVFASEEAIQAHKNGMATKDEKALVQRDGRGMYMRMTVEITGKKSTRELLQFYPKGFDPDTAEFITPSEIWDSK